MGKTWIRIYVRSDAGTEETIVTETALTQDVVVANAAALTNGLTTNGHTVVNGILFDTGKADVKPESSAALDEVVKALKQKIFEPSLRCSHWKFSCSTQSTATTAAPLRSAPKAHQPSQVPMSSTRFPVRSAGSGMSDHRLFKSGRVTMPSITPIPGRSKL